MKNTRRVANAAAPLLVIAAAVAQAAPSEGPDSGHYYEAVSAPGTSWSTASTAASGATLNQGASGLRGHLATITSAAEDAFIHTLRQQQGINPPEAWVGGFQAPGSTEPGAGWTWINGEGPIPPGQSPSPYSNWLAGEPNNLATNPSEDYLAVGLGNAAGWNDEGALGNIGGYIVEYEVVVTANDDDAEATSGVPKQVDVLDNDVVNAAVGSVTIETAPASGGMATVGSGPAFLVTYVSPSNFEGNDTFEYRVTDANGAYAIATVTVAVSADQAVVDTGPNQLIFNQAVNPSPNSNNPLTAAYQQVLGGGEVTIDCCRVLDTREGAGRKGSYLVKDFDLGSAIADTVTNPSCAGMPQVPSSKAKLRPWHRGVPKSEGLLTIGDPPSAGVREHDLGVCVIRSSAESKGVVFSAEEAKNVLGYSLNGAVPSLRYRPFTGGVSIDPQEIDKPYATPWTAEWDESRSGKRYSTNVMVVNLWHEWLLMPSVPYLLQLAGALDNSIKQVKAQGCVENNDGFLNGMRSLLQSASKDILVAALPWLRYSSGQAAVKSLDKATRRALLIGAPGGYDPYNACPGNPQGLFVGRLMALKFAACSELLHPLDSASSLDGACAIEEDILCALPELPGFPHPASCSP